MSKTRSSTLFISKTILILDVIVVWISAAIANLVRFGEVRMTAPQDTLVLATSLFMAITSYSVYQSMRGSSWLAVLARVKVSWLITCFALLAWLFFSQHAQHYSRAFVGVWLFAMLIGLIIERFAMSAALRWLSRRGFNTRDVLVVGRGPMTNDLTKRARGSSWTGYQITRTVDAHDLDAIDELSANGGFDEVWINLSVHDGAHVPKILHALRHSTANIRVVPDMLTYKLLNHGVTFILGVPMMDISSSSLIGTNRLVKVLEDYVLATLILILISPVLLGIALAVKLTSPGPVLFKQKRHGWNGEEIVVYKFRSMKVHAEADNTVTQATKNDTRLTPIGSFLRRSSLDELPQFINVLQGRMSIVGPRPHAIQHNDHYKELIPRYMLRHKMKPGITGWAQINGLRGETETVVKMKARVDYDLYYLENWSLWLDLSIVFKTIFKGFVHKNAY
ncbi:undecaprenyl-phosphate glucose phosphotransferase [Burkholderiaceae bacterium DAT-1]|nr:undecaprenyl-phosphate glucose phosphotransferase [Burkholderiaceae bacterium DAT-1]